MPTRAVYLAGAGGPDLEQGPFGAPADDAVAALGQGIWLAVSMPINPELSVAMLQHLIDETPDDADGAAVAAAAANFVVELRASPEEDDLRLFAGRLFADVARRHSAIDDQSAFQDWVARLELDDPDAISGAPSERH